MLTQREAFDRSDVWSGSAEAGLFSACCKAGGPTAAVSDAFL